MGVQACDDSTPPAFECCFDGDGVLLAGGARAGPSLDGEGAWSRDAEGFVDGGWFSASEDCGDREGVLLRPDGMGEMAPLACLS